MRGSRTASAAITLMVAFGFGIAGATFSGTSLAQPAAQASWHIVDQVHSGANGQFTAVTAVGRSGGWAFNGVVGESAYQRTGSTWKQAPFPKLKMGGEVVTAGATSADNVWAFTDDSVS